MLHIICIWILLQVLYLRVNDACFLIFYTGVGLLIDFHSYVCLPPISKSKQGCLYCLPSNFQLRMSRFIIMLILNEYIFTSIHVGTSNVKGEKSLGSFDDVWKCIFHTVRLRILCVPSIVISYYSMLFNISKVKQKKNQPFNSGCSLVLFKKLRARLFSYLKWKIIITIYYTKYNIEVIYNTRNYTSSHQIAVVFYPFCNKLEIILKLIKIMRNFAPHRDS